MWELGTPWDAVKPKALASGLSLGAELPSALSVHPADFILTMPAVSRLLEVQSSWHEHTCVTRPGLTGKRQVTAILLI